MSPRWSPDGTRLAYVAAGPNGAQLYRPLDGRRPLGQVASLEQAPNDIAWSPDGKTLAFTMLTLDEGQAAGPAVKKPEGAKWAEPLRSSTGSPTAPTARAS
jgi:dipeptidyl aminopeptidase/acylaminoacyl peptidase